MTKPKTKIFILIPSFSLSFLRSWSLYLLYWMSLRCDDNHLCRIAHTFSNKKQNEQNVILIIFISYVEWDFGRMTFYISFPTFGLSSFDCCLSCFANVLLTENSTQISEMFISYFLFISFHSMLSSSALIFAIYACRPIPIIRLCSPFLWGLSTFCAVIESHLWN